MSTEVEVRKPELRQENGAIALRDVEQMYRFGQMVIASGFAPRGITKPEQVVIMVGHGLELGLKPFQSLQNIAVINGRPSLWGDSMKGLIMSQPDLEEFSEEEIGEAGKDTLGYKVTIVRGKNRTVATFTVADAKQAKLWGKDGPWTFYPKRMLQMRARSFACRDAYPDVLKGMRTAEESMDMPAIREPQYVDVEVSAGPAEKQEMVEKLAKATKKRKPAKNDAEDVQEPDPTPDMGDDEKTPPDAVNAAETSVVEENPTDEDGDSLDPAKDCIIAEILEQKRFKARTYNKLVKEILGDKILDDATMPELEELSTRLQQA